LKFVKRCEKEEKEDNQSVWREKRKAEAVCGALTNNTRRAPFPVSHANKKNRKKLCI
jgi:hypothetical protein